MQFMSTIPRSIVFGPLGPQALQPRNLKPNVICTGPRATTYGRVVPTVAGAMVGAMAPCHDDP